jgi:hypothetical protein
MNSSLPDTDALGGILNIAKGHEVSAKAVDKRSKKTSVHCTANLLVKFQDIIVLP